MITFFYLIPIIFNYYHYYYFKYYLVKALNATQKIDHRTEVLLDYICPGLPELEEIRSTILVSIFVYLHLFNSNYLIFILVFLFYL